MVDVIGGIRVYNAGEILGFAAKRIEENEEVRKKILSEYELLSARDSKNSLLSLITIQGDFFERSILFRSRYKHFVIEGAACQYLGADKAYLSEIERAIADTY